MAGKRTRTGSPLNGMDLFTLRLLLTARQEGNLVRVAERENLAISAVSRRILEFEGRFGVTVFSRHDRGVTPTPDGDQLLDRLAQIVERLEQVALDLEEMRDGIRGIVRIRAHMTATLSGAFPARLARFLADNRNIDVQLVEDTSNEIVHAVRVGTCDVGLISGTVDSHGVELIPWMEDQLVAILPVGHRLAGSARLSLDDIAGEPFVGMQRNSALLTLYRTQANAMGRKLQERVNATSFESVREMVAAGIGVAILPAVACNRDSSGSFSVVKLTDVWAHRPLMLCVRQRESLSAAARSLVAYLTI